MTQRQLLCNHQAQREQAVRCERCKTPGRAPSVQTEALWLLLVLLQPSPWGKQLGDEDTNQKGLSPHRNFGIVIINRLHQGHFLLPRQFITQLAWSGTANFSAIFRFTDFVKCKCRFVYTCTSTGCQDVCSIFGKASHHLLLIKSRIDFKLMLMLSEQFPSHPWFMIASLLSSSTLLPSPLLSSLSNSSCVINTGTVCVYHVHMCVSCLFTVHIIWFVAPGCTDCMSE